MKATLEFNLDEVDDKELYELHNQAKGMYWVLYDFLHGSDPRCIRAQLKYNDKLTEDQVKVLEETQWYLLDLLDKHNVSLEVLS